MRIGWGFDVHKFDYTKKNIILAGISIPCEFGLKAVSDGDVLLHSLADAICGGLGIGDIGDYFPDNDKSLVGISSKKIIDFVLEKMYKMNFKILNTDITLITDKPRLVSYKDKIVLSLKSILNIENINLKIKSKEGLDIIFDKEGFSCISVVLLEEC